MKPKPKTVILHIDGIPVIVTRKNIKHLHLRARQPDDGITASAPFFMSDAEVEQWLQSKSDWIQKQVAKFAGLPMPAERKYETGETLTIWGKLYTLQTVLGKQYALTLSGDTAVFTMRQGRTTEQRARFVREWYRERLIAEALNRLPRWEYTIGLYADSLQTKMMKTRWGTCNTNTGKIWLNVRLAEKPPECLDYVLLHELLHLTERKHNARFYALLDRYMPDWRTVKARLNGHANC